MIKVLAGDWPAESVVAIGRGYGGGVKRIVIGSGIFSMTKYRPEDVAAVEIVSEENRGSIGAKLGWGFAGAVLMGPVGAAIGGIAGGNGKDVIIAMAFKDGKRALIRGRRKALEPIIALGFDWASVNLPSPPAETLDALPPTAPQAFDRPAPKSKMAGCLKAMSIIGLIFFGLLVLAIVQVIWDNTSQQGASPTPVYASSRLNIRSAPSTSASVVTSANKGAEISILSEDGDWRRVKIGDIEGWAHSDYLTTSKP